LDPKLLQELMDEALADITAQTPRPQPQAYSHTDVPRTGVPPEVLEELMTAREAARPQLN